MTPHLLCVRASKADWPHLSISAGEDEAICDVVNEDGFLGRIEFSHLLYIQFVCVSVKPGQGCHVIIASRQYSVQPL
jgi:hypothetical protein